MLIQQGDATCIQPQNVYKVVVEKGPPVSTRIIVIATGAEYRKPQCKNLSRFEGVGIYYSATYIGSSECVVDKK